MLYISRWRFSKQLPVDGDSRSKGKLLFKFNLSFSRTIGRTDLGSKKVLGGGGFPEPKTQAQRGLGAPTATLLLGFGAEPTAAVPQGTLGGGQGGGGAWITGLHDFLNITSIQAILHLSANVGLGYYVGSDAYSNRNKGEGFCDS